MKEIHPHPPSKNVPAWASNKKNSCTGDEPKKILVSWKFPTPHLFSTGPSLSYLLSMKVHVAWTTSRNIFQAHGTTSERPCHEVCSDLLKKLWILIKKLK